MCRNKSDESGMTLIETLIALMILLVGLLSMAQVLAFSIIASKTYGRDMTKTTASAHDKMEELKGLRFADTATNVTVNPPYPANGVGLTAGGSIPPAAPAAGYVDYLNFTGARTTAAEAAYTRQWQIVNESATLKRIAVVVTSNKSFRYGAAPSTAVVTQKTP
jgi:prepilin-type N-terminal cleavage/methylation domain-containing protein